MVRLITSSDNEWKNIDLVKLICNKVNEIFAQLQNYTRFPLLALCKGRRLKIANCFVKIDLDTILDTQLTTRSSELGFIFCQFRRRSRGTIEWY